MNPPNDFNSMMKVWASLKPVTQEQAAKGQLEMAIWLWFHEYDQSTMSDAASVHTLAVAVQGILSKVSKDKKVPPSPFMKAMNAQPKKFQDWFRNPQNFFKHGGYRSEPKARSVAHDPGMTEMIISDNVGTYNRLFGVSTPLLDLFLLRYSLVFPETGISLKGLEFKLGERRIDLQHLARLDRIGFLEAVLPVVVEIRKDAQEAYKAKKV